MLRASCLTLGIKEFRCYEAKIDTYYRVSLSSIFDTCFGENIFLMVYNIPPTQQNKLKWLGDVKQDALTHGAQKTLKVGQESNLTYLSQEHGVHVVLTQCEVE